MAKSLRDFMNLVVSEVAEKAAEAITDDVKRAGPYWTGDFEKAWVVRPGNVDITKEGSGRDLTEGIPPRQSPNYTKAAIPFVKPAPKAVLTIGNTSPYREIAMDLLPEKPRVLRKDGSQKNITADPDWYVKYAQTGGLKKSAERGIAEAAKNPKLINFKGEVKVT